MSLRNPVSLKSVLSSLKTRDWDILYVSISGLCHIQQLKNWAGAKIFKFHWFPALSLAVTSVIFLKNQPNLFTSYIFWFQIVYSILYSSSASIYCISYTKGTLYTLYHNFAINSFSRFIKIYSTDICNIFQFRIPKFEVEFQVGGIQILC